MNTTLSQEQITLLAHLSASITGKSPLYNPEIEYHEVWKEAYAQAVAVSTFADIELSNVSDRFRNEIKVTTKSQINKNINLASAHCLLHKILSDAGVKYCILKGWSSSQYYNEPIYRSLGDVDFLVNKKDFQTVTEILVKNGFSKVNHKHPIHEIFTHKGIRYEMHSEPSGIPNGKAGRLVRSCLADTISTSVVKQTMFGEIRVPDTFHHGLILLIHNAHHLTGEGIGLRHLCDWAVFVNSLSNEEFCKIFKQKLRICGLWDFACIMTMCCINFLGIKEKQFCKWANTNTSLELILDILNGGNFGQKDENRSHEALMISQHGKNGIGNKSKLGQLVASGNEIVYNNMPASKKHKILLPVGIVFYGTRYLVRSLTGKRPKIHITDTVKNADSRIEIYKKLHLYEHTEVD